MVKQEFLETLLGLFDNLAVEHLSWSPALLILDLPKLVVAQTGLIVCE